MRKQSKQFLVDLLESPSVSGYEQPVQAVVRKYIGKVADELRTDSHGNVHAVANPGGNPRVMLAGHCDQIGFLVQHVEEDGFIRVSAVGGHDMQIVLGQAVTVWTDSGPLPGAVARKPVHVMSAEDRKKIPELHQLWVDTGLSSKAQVMAKVRIGDQVTYDLRVRDLENDRICSPGLDNKVGCYAVIEAIRLLADAKKLTAAVHSISTVQEEIGLRGAQTSSFAVDPVIGIAVDVTWATDQPDMSAARTGEVKMGKGPVIARGANINPRVFDRLVEIADKKKIPYQINAAPRGTGTDANAMQLSRGGVATGLISIPNRYMHSPVEVCELEDIQNVAKLLAAFCESVSDQDDWTP